MILGDASVSWADVAVTKLMVQLVLLSQGVMGLVCDTHKKSQRGHFSKYGPIVGTFHSFHQ